MRQLRKISNLVAEELKESLDAKGIQLDESVFECKVSRIVDSISEAVDTESDEDILEDVRVDEVYMATSSTTIGGISVREGEFIEISEIDADNDTVIVNIYDEEGELKEEGVEAGFGEIESFTDSAEAVDLDDEDLDECGDSDEDDKADEGVHIRGGKKVKFSAATEKLKAKLKAKKGSGVNKFTIRDGKIVKKSAAQLKADKKKAKTFGKKMKKFARKRAKSLKKFHKLNNGVVSGTVKEGFDIEVGEMKIACEVGDIIECKDGKISVIREGSVIASDISIHEGFMNNCVSESVLVIEGKDCDGCVDTDEDTDGKKEEDVEEGVMLTFRANKGFVVIKEGSEIPVGNRIRARAFLRNEGYSVSAEQIDKASAGEMVIL